jgi:hypothetical protein
MTVKTVKLVGGLCVLMALIWAYAASESVMHRDPWRAAIATAAAALFGALGWAAFTGRLKKG